MASDTSIPTLEDLVAQVAGNDPKALSRLYDRTASVVYGLVLRVVRSAAHAEEVTQEVYLQVWQQAGGFDPQRGSVKAWLVTLAHRRAVDAVRSAQSARDREARIPPVVPDEDVADTSLRKDEQERVRSALASLTDLQLEVIRLAYYEGLTYREVAERLQTPLGTVKTRMRDGLLRLRAALGDEND